MSERYGIDLGTTYSAISMFDRYNNRVTTADLSMISDGNRVVRSVVYYPGPGQEPVVGEAAWNAYHMTPERVAVGIKRSMGTNFKFGPVDGREYSPQEVSAEILKALVKDAQVFFGEDVKDVVITHPAYFGDAERNATMEAGKLAGLNVVALLPEPHAAALAYCVERALDIKDKYLLVYDLGGGTFDVTLVHATVEPGAVDNALNLKIKTITKAGNMLLGGLDWDRALSEFIAEKVKADAGIDIKADAKNEAFLLDNCERAKRALSQTMSTTILADAAQHKVEVSRAEFEDRTASLMLESELLIQQVLDDAEKNYNIPRDQVQMMISGGATRMPMVREMIQRVTGREPLSHGNPDLLVSIGAAYWAHLLTGENVIIHDEDANGNPVSKDVAVPPGDLGDIAAYAIGIEVLRPGSGGQYESRNAVVVPYGSENGKKDFKKTFYVIEDGTKEIKIALYKSERDTEDLGECRHVATFTITGLPDDCKKNDQVSVKLGHDSNGILRGEAEYMPTHRKIDIVVKRELLEGGSPVPA